jgi:two-component system LytT family response regulator
VEKIRTLIVDDEPLAREGIRTRLEREADMEVIGERGSGKEAVAAIRREAPDLVFLDVQMPGLDGFGVIESVGVKQMPHVIFVTAYDEHALRAFEVNAVDYLLKPVDSRRFAEALERARSGIYSKNLGALTKQLESLMAAVTRTKPLERISVKSGGRVTLIGVEEIDWIEAADNYVQVHCGRETHLLHATMNSLESRLDGDRFLRIHRSRIVNVSRVQELQPMFHGEYMVILKDGTRLLSGRSYRERLQKVVDCV